MARVFISHSSRDPEPAGRIKAWLASQGFAAPFLDFDKHAGIPPGADWERTLYNEIAQSEAVIIIQTSNWLASKWCFAEFTQARALGKPIFPIIETPDGDVLISPDIQTLDLRKDEAGGLARLAGELTQLALDAQGGFPWDASRPPYPGLLSFQEEDAAVYFGRDDDIRRLIERLNARRAQGGARLLALLGASGSGKSSLLRAGVIPRLKRAGRQWIVLPPMRPQARPVDELARVLAVAAGSMDWRAMLASLQGDALPRLFDTLVGDLRVHAGAPEAQILLPIDQAEEVFGAADPAQAARFLDILSLALSGPWPFMAVMALRSDYLGLLQSADHLKARFEEFSLGPLPLGRIAQIIEGPARVAGLKVDADFVQQAVLDAETEDALPLLAFALRELYDRAGADHHLSLAEYRSMGDAASGLTPLENAVRRAADGVLADARPDPAALAALREAFVPAMVRVNDQGDYVRRPARWDDLPARAHPLLERLAAARLLVVRQEGDIRQVEVAHEALLRKWPLLRGWLDDAREFLVGSQQLAQDVIDWQQAPAAERSGALLQGLKLNRARSWLAERPQQLPAEVRGFVQASIAQDEAEAARKQRQRRNILRATVAAAAVMAVVAVAAVWQWRVARDTATDLAKRTGELEQQAQVLKETSNSRDQAYQVRANEIIRFAWTDLGAQRDEVLRLEALERDFPESKGKLVRQVNCVDANCTEVRKQPDGYDCQTYLDQGLRYLYCAIRGIIGIPRLQSISGLNVFLPDGPHGAELNLKAADRFGHYNPAFLDWLGRYLIPEGRDNSVFKAVTQKVYDSYIGPTARAFYHAHQVLMVDAAGYQQFEARFQALSQEVAGGRRIEGWSAGGATPLPFATLKAQYSEFLADPVKQKSGRGLHSFEWLGNYLAAEHGDDWYLADTAGSFWVRRTMDGTEAQIFGLIKRLLQTFEPAVLGKP